MLQFKECWGILILALTSAIAPATSADAANLTATIKLKTLPSTITLCRDPTAHADPGYGVDLQWQMGFDIDNNTTTGASGKDVILVAQPTPVDNPCSPSTVATQGNIVAALFKWNGSAFEITSATVNVSLDFAAATVTLTTPATGDLAGLSANSKISASAGTPYSSGGTINVASDATDTFNLGNSVVTPPNDVQNCSGPCSIGASWYPLVDLTGASATTGQTTNSGGGNTLAVEFDVAALHSTLNVCRYPSAFFVDGLSDTVWLAMLNASGTSSGNFSDMGIWVVTPPQALNCTPSTVNTNTALQAYFVKLNVSIGAYEALDVLPVTVDIPAGKITVLADTSASYLAGLSASSLFSISTQTIYSSTDAAIDAMGTTLPYGAGRFSDPIQDVQNCASPCATGQTWYPEIDLVGASVRLDGVFRNSFE